MKKVILALLLGMALFGQGNSITTDELTIKGNNPPQVTGAAISVIGAAGNTNYYYWVIVNYPIGKSFPFGPIGAFNVANTLSVSNYVRVGWNAALGADSYDVLRTSTPTAPNGSCTCAVATGTTSLFVNDQGAALGAYTISTAGEAKTKMYVNNLSNNIPLLTVTGTGWDMSGATATRPNVTGNGAPVGSCLNGSTYQQLDAANIYVCVSSAWSAISGGGGGGVPSGPAGGDLAGTYPNPSLATTGAVAGSYGGATSVPQMTVDAKGRISSIANVTITGTTPGGSAGGDLTGTFPNPTLVTSGASAGTYGNATNTPQITVDAKGRITSVSNVAITNSPSGAAGGDLTGSYPNPTVATVGGYSAANVAAGATLANAAVSANTANAIVRRNASGQFAGALIGNADTASTAGAFTNNPTDCTSGQYANAIAANGDLTCAQVAYSQVSGTPSALPPSGAAGGDLTGTFPNPTLTTSGATAGTYGNANQVAQITVDAKGRITSVADVTITGAAPTGLAGGDLTGNYPNPSLVTSGVAAGSYGSSTLTPVITVDAKGRVTSATTTATSAVPGGAAGGDLSGTYPNPSVATVGGYSAANTAAGATLANAATNANTANAIVRRNASGQFSGTLLGNADTATALAANPTDCSAGQYANTIAANGNLTCAQVAYSQISGTPSALPPSGSAGGDLTGSYPNPTLTTTGAVAGTYGSASQIPQVTVDAKGRISSVSNVAITGLAPSGPAGGDLAGTYPNPTLTTSGAVAGSYGSSTLTPSITVDAKGRITSIANVTTSNVPGGSAGGDLTGTYPNPTLATSGVVAGTYGNSTQIPQFIVDAKGRITSVSNVTASTTPGGAAGGDLTGTYPNPTLTTTGVAAGSYGGTNITSSFTVDAKGRISTAASANVGAGLTGTLTSNGTSMSAVAAASQGQYYRRKYNQTSVTYEFATAPWAYVSDFAFSYTNGGSNITADLSATGAKSVTVTPCPAGVAGTNTNHYLRISGGTGTAETVLITGGTCTSGASSGTLNFTTVQTHTGGWALATATAGLQEAYYSNAPVKLVATDGEYRMYAQFYCNGKGGNTVLIQGQGIIATRFIRDSSYAAGNLFYWDGATDAGNLILKDLKILNGSNSFNNTSGTGLYLNTSVADHITLQNIYVENGYNTIRVEGSGTVQSLASQFRVLIDYPYSTDAIWLQNGKYFQITNTWITNAKQSGSTEVAIKISQADGAEIVDSFISGRYGIYVVNDSSQIFNFLYIDSNIIDSCYQYGIFVDSTAHNAVFEQMRISNNHIVHSYSGVGSSTGVGVYIANNLKGVQLVNNNIIGWKYTGVIWGTAGNTPPGGAIVGNIIANNNQTLANGYGLLIYNDTDLAGTTITGNTINNSASSVNPAYQNCGIYFVGASGTFNGYTVTGNDLSGNTVAAICTDVSPVFSNFVLGNNGGVDNATGSVSSAATITLGIFPQYIVDGSTNVSTINGGWPGRQVQITKSDAGSYTITTGGNIVSPAIAMNQYSTALCTFNGPINAWVCK